MTLPYKGCYMRYLVLIILALATLTQSHPDTFDGVTCWYGAELDQVGRCDITYPDTLTLGAP